jgi:hypothetical protein
MKTAKQVRAYIREIAKLPRGFTVPLYTNKVKDPAIRNVKLYTGDLAAEQQCELIRFVGRENVRYTAKGRFGSMIIKCAYEQ